MICGTRKRSRKKQLEVCDSLTELESLDDPGGQDLRSPDLKEVGTAKKSA